VLAAALRSGSANALAHAFDRWHQRVRVLARRLLAEDAAAEDVVQETFAALSRAAGRYRGDAALETFLLAIAIKRARHHARAALRRRRTLENYARLDIGGIRDPEHHTYRAQLAARMASALDRLPRAQREAFVLCAVEGLSSAEASVLVAAPEGTVRTRLLHARRRLRDLLSEEHDE
jgi:RNA polymerase sigma-70 factor (ECF subfamily)